MREHISVGMVINDQNMFENLRFRVNFKEYYHYLLADPILVSKRVIEAVPNVKIIMGIRNQIRLACMSL